MWFECNVMYSVCIYDLSVLAVSRMGFQKKKYLDRGWVGGLSYIQIFLDFWNFFNFAKPLRETCYSSISITVPLVLRNNHSLRSSVIYTCVCPLWVNHSK